MESGNGGASSKGVLVPMSSGSDAFQNNIWAPLKSAYLYEESKQSFRYKSAFLIKNPELEQKYNAFREKRKEEGYSEEDLKESYGFLLFDDVNKARALGETGVLTGNSTCTTLGDPSKGVYISMYSDCLDLNRWYHGKSGYIAIIRLTKGKVKKVLENYTQNLTEPTERFDCHVSEQLPSVSSNTSSFLAFERTQYYIYELLHDGSNETVQSPSAACPFAIVSFSYTDTKSMLVEPEEKSEEKKQVFNFYPWRGQLQIGTNFYDVGLRSTARALIPAELPPVVKIDRAISLLHLRQLLPRAVFETCFSGEVFLDGLYCSLCELVSTETEETSSVSLLLSEIKEKDVALAVLLSDGGFLILLHSSHFLTYDDTGSSATEVLQGIFVFPDSRVIQKDTKFGQRKPAVSSEILRVLPVLSYAEGEVEKTPIDPSEELCEVFAQHMQSYAALINPGLTLSPSRDISIFPDQYDVPDAHKHLYKSPEWTNRAWQNFKSYLSKPVSFQLPVSKASEILVAGQEERMEDLDDDIYFCLSSPEETPASQASMESEDQQTGQKSVVNVEKSVDSYITSAKDQVDLTTVPQSECLQPGDATKDTEMSDLKSQKSLTEKSNLTLLIRTDDMGTKSVVARSTSDELPAELIVSITSAERTVTDGSLSATTAESATKHDDFQNSVFSTAKVQTEEGNSLNDENFKTKKVSECPDPTNCQTKHRKYRRDNLKSQREESSTRPELSKSSNIDWRKGRKRKRVFGTLSSKHRKLRSAALAVAVAEEKKSKPGQQSLESTILMELEAFPLRKKTERWDLKPVISECGRILVPHGSVDFVDQIKTLNGKPQSTKDEPCHEKMLVDGSAKAHDTVEMEQVSSTAKETAMDKTEDTTFKDEGNHPQNIDSGNASLTLNPKSSEHSSKNDSTDTPPLKTVQEKHPDTPSAGKCATKGEFLLKKLKSVLLRGKRKIGIIVSQETSADTTQDTEPCLKKGKVDSEPGMLENNDAITSAEDTNLGVKEVSKMLSVDPLFAYALGLTPKNKTKLEDKQIKAEGQDTHERKDSLETQEDTILDKQSQIIQRPLSIFPRRGRIKTLKKHQGISEEHVKKKWWLHFQTPACFASEKQTNKERTRDNSVSKTVKEKSNSTCSSTDALTLLADLALSANNDQVPPQPDPALERKPETSLKKCDLTKDVTSGEQESVLHALLRQPAARPMQPLESPSPSHFVGGSELVGLISKEHDYSLPPSSSLLLDLSGSPFQVSPLSGSTRLLHHHQTMYGDGIKTLHYSVDKEDRSENNHRTPEYLKKQMARRRKFRQSRTFVIKDDSLQITKQRKENYDFNLDSRFTNDTKERAIVRAIHGPWDLSIQDTNEEVRLIVHMWIGLFYSRSTARFFHFDSNCSTPCQEESDSLEVSSGMVSAPAKCEVKVKSLDTCPVTTDSSETLISKALDLSKKDNSLLDQGSAILDLSLRNSNVETVTSDLKANKKKTSLSAEEKEAGATLNTLESSVGLQSSCRKSVHSSDIISEVNDVRSAYESKRTCTTLPKAVHLEHSDVPSLKGGGTLISVQDKTASVSTQLEDRKTDSRLGLLLHRFNNQKTDMKDDIDKSCATEMSFVQTQGRDSSRSVIDKSIDSNKKAGDAVDTVEHDDIESKDGENCQVKEKPYQEGSKESFEEMIHTGDDSTEEGSGPVCNGGLVENEMQPSGEEPQAVSAGKAENVDKDEDCHAVHEVKVIEDDQSKKMDGKEDGKEDGLDEKDKHISDVKADSGVNDQPSPMMCNGPDSVKENCISECYGQTSFDEQPPQADSQGETCHDLELRKLCPNGSALADEHAVPDEAPHAPSEMELSDNEPAVEENLEKGVCLVDLKDDTLPMMSDGPDSVKDCITEYNGQTPLGEEPSQAKNEDDACNDLELGKLCANGSVLTDEHSILEKAPRAPSEMELVDNESAIEENSESGNCLAELSDYPPSMINDGPDSVKDFAECNDQAPLNEQPLQADNEEDTCPSLQFKKLCANDSALTDEPAISEKAPTQSDMEPIDNATAVEVNSENCISSGVLSDQPIPMICDGTDTVNKDCITECNLQAPLDVQPYKAENKGDTCHDLQLRNVCANDSALRDEHDISEKAPHPSSQMEPIQNEPVAESNSENNTCLADEAHFQKSVLPTSEESLFSLVGSTADGSATQTNDIVATGNQNKAMATFSRSLHDHEDQDTKSDEEELNADNTTQKDLVHHQSHSPQCDTVTGCETEEALNKETDLKIDETSKGLEKIDGRIVIPFIGIDISGEDVVQSDDSHSECNVEDGKGENGISFIHENTYPETVLPKEVCSTSQIFGKKEELTAGKKSLFDERETNQPEISESEPDERCPTPTMDEEPYQYLTCYDPSSSSSSLSGSETCKNMTQQYVGRSSTFIKDEMPLEQKIKSSVGSDPSPQHGLRPDLELRTLRVLQSIGKFLSQSGHPDKSSQIKTADTEHSLDQKDKHLDTSTGHNYCHPHTSFSSTELMQAFTPNIDQDRSKTTSQTNLGHESRSNSQRPVMAVKPSKSDDLHTPVVTYIPPTSMLFEIKTERNSVGPNDDMQEASEHSSKISCLANVWDIKSNSNKAQFNQYQGRDPKVLKKTPSSSLPLQSFESAKTSSKRVDGKQCFLTNSLVEKAVQATNKSIEMDQRDCSDASTSVANYKDDGIMNDSLFLGPQSSITCTVFNTSRKRPVSFLEQLSQRCLQEDPTLASMEQECLIFSEQMKQLLKRSNRGPIQQLDAHERLNVPCSSPVTVHFSSLEEEEDSLDYLDAPSLVGQKIEVDMSDKTDLAEEENTLHTQKSSQRTGNPLEHAGVSNVTAECAKLYKEIMNDVCAVRTTRSKHFTLDRGYPKTEPSNHFDFCDQMKRDMDESFRSSLNSVVKKSCKTKYRFYILVTSDDAFFDETKAHLEAEGHTAVQPSEFFLDEGSTPSLLIIIRNEDIAEHICEVPHLLELKKSPGVQFAGIDEPDDVVNLTHQELFMRGGFVMFDTAALESLSLCNMKKISEILQELSRTGKWKWLLHYRDSRRMKENARLSTEAKEKTKFLNWCQEVGILEVLPYHECDLMSRDQPDHLTCLVRLQVQNISARYPVFITDTTTDSGFGTNGILTLTFSSFLTSKTFTV